MGNSTSYPTDLTDAEWEILAPLIPSALPGGRPRRQNMRAIVNAMLYVLRGGISWRMLPHDLPKWKTVYDYFWKWRRVGLWEEINGRLRERVRLAAGRHAQPTAAILDSQTVKTAHPGGPRGRRWRQESEGAQTPRAGGPARLTAQSLCPRGGFTRSGRGSSPGCGGPPILAYGAPSLGRYD